LNETKGEKVVRNYDQGKAARQNFDARVDLIAPYCDPTRTGAQSSGETISAQNMGRAVLSQMYDGEGIYASDLCAKFIGSELHPVGSKWFTLTEERDELNDEDEVREWLEEARDRMLKDLGTSNFYAEAYESDKDWSTFGCGDFNIEERPIEPYTKGPDYRGTRFQAYKSGRFVIYENGWGEVDARYSEINVTARAAYQLFGDKVMDPSMGIAEVLRGQSDATKLFKFIQGIYPRQDDEKGKYGNHAMPWADCWVEYKTKKEVKESGFEEFPDCAPRWSRIPGEPYGRGLGEIALNECITVNAVKRAETEALSLRIKPPIALAHGSVLGTALLRPWGLITLRTGGRAITDLIQPLNMGSDFSVSNLEKEDFRAAIRKAFYVDQLVELMRVTDSKPMTAYEVSQKVNILQKVLGPVYGRWQSEFGVPFIRRHFNLMLRRGAFSTPPDILLEMGGKIKVQFESPLAKAQRMEEVRSIIDYLTYIAPVAESQFKYTGKADVLDPLDFDKVAELLGHVMGVPAKVTRGEREIATLRQSRAAQEQQQQANSEMMGLTEGLKNVAPFIQATQPAPV
jgi:hypothetical protein